MTHHRPLTSQAQEEAIRRFYQDPAFHRLVLRVMKEAREQGSSLGRAIEAVVNSHRYLEQKPLSA